MNIHLHYLGLVIAVTLLLASSVFSADDSLESQLLEGLPAIEAPKPQPPKGSQSPDKSPPSANAGLPSKAKPTPNDSASPTDPSTPLPVIDGEDVGQSAKQEDPLARVLLKMRSSRDRLKLRDTTTATQSIQQQIVQDLEAMLASSPTTSGQSQPEQNSAGQANSSAQDSPGDGSASPSSTQESDNRVDPNPQTEVQLVELKNQLRRVWGHLPEKVREQMISGMSEEFLPKYEKLIEAYYKRLADEPVTSP